MSNVKGLAKIEPIREAAAVRSFEPNGIEEAYRLSKILVASGLMPKHVRSPEAAFAILAAGRELGLTAMQSMRSLYFVEGKVTLSADLMVALVKKHPDCLYFRIVENTNDRCTCETKRDGEEPTRMTWAIEDASKAGLTGKDNWKKYPKAMLRARVSADLCRAVYPDALLGTYDPDELERIPKERGSGPVVTQQAREQVVEYDQDTGEVEPTPLLRTSVDRSQVTPANDGDDALDGALAQAVAFGERIQACATAAELYDLALEIKRAKLAEDFTRPLRESVALKKKDLAR